MLFGTSLREIILRIPAVLLAISVHECAHGYAAYLLGDKTAKYSGRLSLNPIRHMDLMGTICMVLFGFGWASPVPVNPQYFKNPKGGMSLVGLAGPVSNFLMAFVFAVFYGVLYKMAFQGGIEPNTISLFFNEFLWSAMLLNVGLGIFNLIPFPPLDGSKILAYFLPNKWYYKLMEYERFAMPILMILLFFGVLDRPFSIMTGHVVKGLFRVITAIVGV